MNQNISPEERDNASEIDLRNNRRKSNIVALIVCTLVAFVLWLAIRNATDLNQTPTLPPATDQVTQQNS